MKPLDWILPKCETLEETNSCTSRNVNTNILKEEYKTKANYIKDTNILKEEYKTKANYIKDTWVLT